MANSISEDTASAVLAILGPYYPNLTGQELTAFLEASKSGPKQQKPLKPMTRQEVCDYLSVSSSTVNRYLKSGLLKAIHIGPRLVRVDPYSVQSLMAR